jgi:catechol 2,3-dioxygenase-like lactoylglutathione lyase family enzyme
MKRLHLHVHVDDLERSIGFYTALFGVDPGVRKADYAKWLIDDPRVNFAISQRGGQAGIGHLGIQVDSRAELDAVSGRLKAAGRAVREQEAAACCYAVSDKGWSADPDGVVWETFHTTGEVTDYGDDIVATAELARLAGAAAAPEESPEKRDDPACCRP